MATEWVYYKKNVNFNVGIRFHLRDSDGLVLTNANPYINIDKVAIQQGLIIPTEEPELDAVTDNAITDEQAEELVKNLFVLKKKLAQVNSEATLGKLYDAAKRQNRSKKILAIIEDRLAEVSPLSMEGVEWSRGEESTEDGE
jgi:hypothetical protein